MRKEIVKIEAIEFDNIGRGTSVTIPVLIKRLDGTPFDLTDYEAFFTMKQVQWDYDYEDARACIYKEVEIEEPEEGKFFIQLSSKETWRTPGDYHFDIELVREGAVFRMGLFFTTLVGGPANRNVNPSLEPISFTNSLQITLGGTSPLTIVTPLISDPPENLIETIVASPPYILEVVREEDEDDDDPIRNVKIRSWAPKASMVMHIRDPRDGERRQYYFIERFHPDPPEGFPFNADAYVEIMNREIHFHLPEIFIMEIFDMFHQHLPEPTADARFTRLQSNQAYRVKNNVTAGQLTIAFLDTNRRQVHMTINYTMPHEIGSPSTWLFRIDYFDWTNI
jgi:hypothetical protein